MSVKLTLRVRRKSNYARFIAAIKAANGGATELGGNIGAADRSEYVYY